MKTFIFSILSLTLFSSCFSKMKGKQVIVEQQLEQIKGVDISSAFSVKITKGDINSVKISIPEDSKDYLVVKVEDGILKLHINESYNNFKLDLDALTAEIVCSTLEYVKTCGAVSITVNSPLDLNELKVESSAASGIVFKDNIVVNGNCEIKSSGASSVTCNIKAESIDLSTSGASSLKIQGSCKKFKAKLSGASNIDCKNFYVVDADVSSSGSSSLTIEEVENLSTYSSGASQLRYKKATNILNSKEEGASSLKKL